MIHFKFIDHTNEGVCPGTLIFSVFAMTATEADKAFEEAFGKNPIRLPHIGLQVHPVLIGHILMSSGLFESKSDCLRSIKGKSVKVNRVTVESFNEPLEQGDFINFMWLPGSLSLLNEHGKGLLTIHKGKAAALIRVTPQGVEILT